ncbi:MAG TPA: histidine phosphatase family protein [Microvirga sp.]|jgi:broad specificity phosphatase PhoE|nr:histidine phosphatase family protein [Microvirga sp.]
MARIVFVTHPEVVIDPAVPVPQWPLSAKGRARMEAFLAHPVLTGVRAVASSGERKARDGAEIIAAHFSLPILVDEELGENDRSATGYIAPPEFWEVVDAFFARSQESVRGWERAADAQARILRAVTRIARRADIAGDVAVVSHGGVGTLLLAYLSGVPDARSLAQPHGGGGCYFVIDRESMRLVEGWRVIDRGGPMA